MEFPYGLRTWLALIAVIFSPLANAAQCQASSGPQRMALLELYTSEGCSSCPPADRWLSTLSAQGFPPNRVIPIALHVDYWDYIGWRDRFSNPAFSARQRESARISGARTVYTPQFMLNGRDFRAWRSDALMRAVDEINRSPAGADIRLALKPVEKDRIEIVVAASAKAPDRAALYVAVYQNDLSSDVRAGENSGARLHHDYVVREWRGPAVLSTATPWQQAIALKPEWVVEKMGVVAFVQDTKNGEILQAVRLPLCPG